MLRRQERKKREKIIITTSSFSFFSQLITILIIGRHTKTVLITPQNVTQKRSQLYLEAKTVYQPTNFVFSTKMNLKYCLTVLFFVSMWHFSESQRFLKGKCPPTPILKNFDWNRVSIDLIYYSKNLFLMDVFLIK